jgi:hypothetical protein
MLYVEATSGLAEALVTAILSSVIVSCAYHNIGLQGGDWQVTKGNKKGIKFVSHVAHRYLMGFHLRLAYPQQDIAVTCAVG